MLSRDVFDRAVATMVEVFGETVTPERTRIYWHTLKDEITDAEMLAATEKILKSSKFFPRIAEILEAKQAGAPKSLMIPGRYSCAMCGVSFSFPASRERGYCGPCWRSIGGEVEDARDEQTHEVTYRDLGQRRIGATSVGDILGELGIERGEP